MSFNSSQLLEVWCFNLKFFKVSRNTSPYSSGNSYNLCCHLTSGTDGSCSKCFDFDSNLEKQISQDSFVCYSCWIVLPRLLHWVTESTILCCVQIGRQQETQGCSVWLEQSQKVLHFILPPWICRHGNNSYGKMAAYEPKVSPYDSSTRCFSYHLSSLSLFHCSCSHVWEGNESRNIYCNQEPRMFLILKFLNLT